MPIAAAARRRQRTVPEPGPFGRAALSVVGVGKSYGCHRALRGVDLAVAPGEVVALLGPNGAGKTTLLSIAAGILRADDGAVHVNGWNVARQPLQAQCTLGIAPQDTGLYEPLTVDEDLRFFGELAGLPRHGARLEARVARITEALVLGDLRSRPCQLLSGGERRRVHTAIALITEPRLLLLDEPTVGADIETRTALLGVVGDLAAAGTAVLYTTHYLHEVESLDARVVLIDRGRVVAEGAIDRLVADHGSGELELRFDGPAPTVAIGGVELQVHGDRLVVETPEPALVAPRVLDQLGPDLHRLRDVRILRPSLESVFLNLTGGRSPGPGDGRRAP